jgi:capping protein alpha
MTSQLSTISAFVEGAPPGEVSFLYSVVKLRTDLLQARRCYCRYYFLHATIESITEAVLLDIKALTIDTPNLVSQLGPAFEKYNEEQFATVKLPGSSQHVSSIRQSGGILEG